MDDETLSISERVANGIALLDKTTPDWRDRLPSDIDVTLNMAHPTHCILGFVYAKEAGALRFPSGYGYAQTSLNLSDWKAAQHGFDTDPDGRMDSDEEYARLRDAWLNWL